jgi:hypothetical protein
MHIGQMNLVWRMCIKLKLLHYWDDEDLPFFFCLSLGCRKKKGDNEKNLIHEPRGVKKQDTIYAFVICYSLCP